MGLVVFLDLTRTAVLVTTVSMALRPAAFMVSPDSAFVSPVKFHETDARGLTNEVNNAIGNTQRTSGLDTSPNILDIGLFTSITLTLKPRKELPRKRRETSHHIPPNQILGTLETPLHRHLHLQLAPPETKIYDLLDARGLSVGELSIVLSDLVAACDSDVDAAFTDEGGDVGSREEDKGDGEVLDEGYVETGFAAELYVTAGEEVEGCLLEAALFFVVSWVLVFMVICTGGTCSWGRRRGVFLRGWNAISILYPSSIEPLTHWLTRSMMINAGQEGYQSVLDNRNETDI